ncbi:hypothetical protein B0H16DRAFT_1734066 [Mycena metata]|uniref:Uncharacterized protein n=1 Tax=Mycena metata TaxID=1033252 RepID=A0AAD7HXV1_9AGAR|nr:hypothetical protein B0H16DRAFT_1734066 [Mycena metata]
MPVATFRPDGSRGAFTVNDSPSTTSAGLRRERACGRLEGWGDNAARACRVSCAGTCVEGESCIVRGRWVVSPLMSSVSVPRVVDAVSACAADIETGSHGRARMHVRAGHRGITLSTHHPASPAHSGDEGEGGSDVATSSEARNQIAEENTYVLDLSLDLDCARSTCLGVNASSSSRSCTPISYASQVASRLYIPYARPLSTLTRRRKPIRRRPSPRPRSMSTPTLPRTSTSPTAASACSASSAPSVHPLDGATTTPRPDALARARVGAANAVL